MSFTISPDHFWSMIHQKSIPQRLAMVFIKKAYSHQSTGVDSSPFHTKKKA
jgi:hypothetical protein